MKFLLDAWLGVGKPTKFVYIVAGAALLGLWALLPRTEPKPQEQQHEDATSGDHPREAYAQTVVRYFCSSPSSSLMESGQLRLFMGYGAAFVHERGEGDAGWTCACSQISGTDKGAVGCDVKGSILSVTQALP